MTNNFTKNDARGLKQMMYFSKAKTQSLFHQENIVLKPCTGFALVS